VKIEIKKDAHEQTTFTLAPGHENSHHAQSLSNKQKD
jgi:hypothetical protein